MEVKTKAWKRKGKHDLVKAIERVGYFRSLSQARDVLDILQTFCVAMVTVENCFGLHPSNSYIRRSESLSISLSFELCDLKLLLVTFGIIKIFNSRCFQWKKHPSIFILCRIFLYLKNFADLHEMNRGICSVWVSS